MFRTTKITLLFAGLCLTGNILRADAIRANGICELNSCAGTDTLAPGASVADSFSFVYTFANSDRYQATGTIGAYNNSDTSGTVGISAANITLTYLGNASGTASGTDTLAIDFLQYFQTPWGTFSNESGHEYISGVFGGPIANASSVRAQGFSNGGTAMALMGPFFPANPFTDSRSDQPFSGGASTLLDSRDTLTFGAGSAVGSQIALSNVPPASQTPEPSTLLLAGAGLVMLMRRASLAKMLRPAE